MLLQYLFATESEPAWAVRMGSVYGQENDLNDLLAQIRRQPQVAQVLYVRVLGVVTLATNA